MAPYADLLGPLQKRGRTDAYMAPEDCFSPSSPTGSSGSGGAASSLAEETAARRRQVQEVLQEFCAEQPEVKRLRLGDDHLMSEAGASAAGVTSEEESSCREAAVRQWSEELVRALQGCPSVQEASQRCARVLTAFEADVRQAAAREAEDAGTESVQTLQQTKKVLMRAVHHLAQRCRQAEACAAEAEGLKEELDKSKDAHRRLAHHNDLLQCHLKLHLDSCR